MNTITRCFVALCLFALSTAALFAQSNQGSITGTISDPTGAVIPTAVIEVKNSDTGAVYQGGTSGTGNYVIPVPAGTYQLTVTATGFKKSVRKNLVVTTATAVRQDLTLEVGATSETLTVTDAAPLLKTETGEVSHVVTSKEADNLPVLSLSGGTWNGATALGNIRNPLSSAQLIPGVVFSNDQTLSVNGLPANSQAIRIEGQDSTSTIWKVRQQDSQGGVDAIQEVSVQTSNFAAEFGQAGGGYFNFTMKSGTNQYHGSAYDYFVNEVLNAGTPFTDAGVNDGAKAGNHVRNAQRRNDYGFTFGGPVVIPKLYDGHDKTFLFFNFEQFRENRSISNGLTTVPTDAYRNGNFSTSNCSVYNPATGGCTAMFGNLSIAGKPVVDPLGNSIPYSAIFDPHSSTLVNGVAVRSIFPGNIIPQNYQYFDPVAANIQNLLPPQNINALVNNYNIPAYTTYQHSTNPSFKIDHSVSSTIKLSLYLSRQLQLTPNSNGFPDTWGGAVINDNRNTTTRLNYDQTLRPTLLLHVGIGYFTTQRPNLPATYDQNQLWPSGNSGFYDTTVFPTLGGLSNFFTGGWGPNFGGLGGSFKAVIKEQKPTANTSLTWVKNNHTFKFGGEYTGEGYPTYSSWRANGNFTFNANETGQPWLFGQATQYGDGSGFPYASFLLGLPDSMGLSQTTQTRVGGHMLGLYAQDNWKVTRKLTLEYGIRYDYQTYLKEQYGRMADASFATPNPTVGGLLGAVVYEGNGDGRCNCALSHNYPFAIGPRLSAAYQIDTKTVLRAGAGVSYGVVTTPQGSSYSVADFYTINPAGYGISPLQATGGLAGGNPYAANNPYGNPQLTWPNFDSGKYPTRTVAGLPPQTPFIYYNPNNRPGRIASWSLGVQREVMRDLVIDVSYVGNRGAWFYAPKLDTMATNGLTPDRLAQFGLDFNNATDRGLLTKLLSDPAVIARGFGPAYPGMPLSQTLLQVLRPVPQWAGSVTPYLGTNNGNTWYDSLQAKVTKRYSHGLDMQASFTWSKADVLGSGSDTTYFLPGTPVTNDIFNRMQNKQLNQLNKPLALIISGTYQTPKTPGDGMAMKVLSQVVRDWQIGAVLQYQSGDLIQSPNSNNQLLTQLGRSGSAVNNGTTPWNVVADQPRFAISDPNCHCFDPQQTQVLNPAAWVDVPGGQWGASAPFYEGYRWQRQPSENMSLGRNFRMGPEGKYNLQVRAEFQNVFNRVFLSKPTATNPTTAISSANGIVTGGYGSINTVNGAGTRPRTGLLVARFTF